MILKGSLWFHIHATQGGCGPLTSLRTLLASNARAGRAPPKIVTFRRGDAAARAVIGPLTKTRRRTINVHDCVEASVWSLSCGNVGPYKGLKSLDNILPGLFSPSEPSVIDRVLSGAERLADTLQPDAGWAALDKMDAAHCDAP